MWTKFYIRNIICVFAVKLNFKKMSCQNRKAMGFHCIYLCDNQGY